MKFTNPFEEDTSYYKDLIDADVTPGENIEYISDDDVDQTVHEFLDNSTIQGFPASAVEAIQLAKKKSEIEKQNQKQVASAFEKLFEDLNQKYGLDIKLDYDSFSDSLRYIIDPTNKKALELYISEAYGRYRVILYMQYLQAISMLSAQILNPDYILSDSLTYEAKLQTMKQLYEFMQTMNEIYEQVNVPDTELKLEKLAETKNQFKTNLDDPVIRDYLEQLTHTVKISKPIDVNAIENKNEES